MLQQFLKTFNIVGLFLLSTIAGVTILPAMTNAATCIKTVVFTDDSGTSAVANNISNVMTIKVPNATAISTNNNTNVCGTWKLPGETLTRALNAGNAGGCAAATIMPTDAVSTHRNPFIMAADAGAFASAIQASATVPNHLYNFNIGNSNITNPYVTTQANGFKTQITGSSVHGGVPYALPNTPNNNQILNVASIIADLISNIR
jgi:hypothetical protein